MADSSFTPLRNLPDQPGFKSGDVMVVFGELFSRGYANGLVEAAERRGMTIVRATVGRREKDGQLRALNEEEKAGVPKPFINIPLEAGFDMEPASDGISPCDHLATVKMKEWDSTKLDFDKVEESRVSARKRFQKNVAAFFKELEALIPEGANVLFAHTMAGGVPRAKVLMPTMNKVFKGKGDRFLASKAFWESDIGRLCDINFNEVTADTFYEMVKASLDLRERLQKNGGQTYYVAYGYHGTEVLMNGSYQWQSYSPYVQGWAKVRLEDHAKEFWSQGLVTSVYNCPEILTNSSSIFLGVEVCLYPLIGALLKEGGDSTYVQGKVEKLKSLLQDGISIDKVLQTTDNYLTQPTIQNSYAFEGWPQHNEKEQMELMLNTSAELIAMHKDTKDLMTFQLSQDVFSATGEIMLGDIWSKNQPVSWLGHDIVAKQMIHSEM